MKNLTQNRKILFLGITAAVAILLGLLNLRIEGLEKIFPWYYTHFFALKNVIVPFLVCVVFSLIVCINHLNLKNTLIITAIGILGVIIYYLGNTVVVSLGNMYMAAVFSIAVPFIYAAVIVLSVVISAKGKFFIKLNKVYLIAAIAIFAVLLILTVAVSIISFNTFSVDYSGNDFFKTIFSLTNNFFSVMQDIENTVMYIGLFMLSCSFSFDKKAEIKKL